MKNKTVELTEDNLKKSLSLIDDITKGIKPKELNTFQKAVLASENEEENIGGENKTQNKEDMEKGAFEKALSEANKKIDSLEKAITESGKESASIKKSLSAISELGTLIKGFQTEIKAKDELIKGLQGTVETVVKENKEFADRLKKLEDTHFFGKSKTTDFIKKAFGGETPAELKDKNVLSLTGNKQEIKNLLGTKMEGEMKKGLSEREAIFAQAALAFEAKGTMSKEAISALNKEGFYFVD